MKWINSNMLNIPEYKGDDNIQCLCVLPAILVKLKKGSMCVLPKLTNHIKKKKKNNNQPFENTQICMISQIDSLTFQPKPCILLSKSKYYFRIKIVPP